MRPVRHAGRWVGFALLAILAIGPLSAPALGAPTVPPAVTPGTPVLSPSLAGGPSSTQVGAHFWGADVRPYYSLGAGATSTYRSSGLSVVRWPGGAVADRLNVTSNRIYNDNGTVATPAVNESTFVAWCRAVGCAAVIGLPGEIDSPATAAYDVRYTEQSLRFTPLYWEIGNEPALWTHFGIPWGQWNSTQASNATPASYANLVRSYAAAIHSVDPTAHILGLPGVGQGAYGEAGWIRATVALNGPNLSGVAIHVYPAGGNVTGAPSLSTFYATLDGPSSLPSRLPVDEAAVAAACRTCGPIPVLATELGSGTQGGAYNSYMTGFPDVPYIAAEAVQALSLNLSQSDLFALQASYGGSLLAANGSASPVALLYEDLLSRLGPVVSSTFGGGPGSHVAGIVTRTNNGSSDQVLVANTNVSQAFLLAVRGPASPYGFDSTVVTWNATTGQPVVRQFTGVPVPLVRVPAESVALLVVNASLHVVRVVGATPTAPWVGAGAVVPGAVLGVAVAGPLLARRRLAAGRVA